VSTDASTSLVSIIIPCYNYGHLLAETLQNVQAQSYTHWECLVVDDGSTDNTPSVAQAFAAADARFRYIQQANAGTSAAKNTGLQQAKGAFIQFLDADDLLAPQKLSLQVAYLQQHPEVGIVYSNVRYFDHQDPSRLSRSFDMRDKAWMACASGGKEQMLPLFMVRNQMVISAPLCRAEIIKAAGTFDTRLKGCEDWEFWIRCAATGAVFHYDEREEVLTYIRVHPASATQNISTMLTGELSMRHSVQRGVPLSPKSRQINARTIRVLKSVLAFSKLYKGPALLKFRKLLALLLRAEG
jgi:glycosyltransferase involved in cell wall biosynthesis